MKVQFKFKTFSGNFTTVEMTTQEALADPMVAEITAHVIKLSQEGAIGATFDRPFLGKVEVTLVEAA
jgi:hypothetical protein